MRKTNIRKKIQQYVMVMGVLSIFSVIFANYTIEKYLKHMQTSFDYSQNLSDFYTNIPEMDYAARTYIYEQTEENLTLFRDYEMQCRNNLNLILSTDNATLKWRIERLYNMIDYFCKAFEAFLEGKLEPYEAYKELEYRKKLIVDTAAKYYQHLADYMEIEKNELRQRWFYQRGMLFISLIILIISIYFVVNYYSKSICDPIEMMVYNTQRLAKGNYDLIPIQTTFVEMDILIEAFEEMAKKVQNNVEMLKKNAHLEQKILKHENDSLVMKNLVTEAQLKYLQSQINPHFLFNTLSMLANTAYINNDMATADMIYKLSECFHYTLEKSNKDATLYEEIELLKNYIYIQQKRFMDQIYFELEVDENIPDISVPAIVLQPLLENAIVHGVSQMTEQAVINIEIKCVSDTLVMITIEDNGKGMNSEELEMLQVKLQSGLESSSDFQGGVGLSNVYSRLRMYFGNDMQFNIESEEECGTVITLLLPWNR